MRMIVERGKGAPRITLTHLDDQEAALLAADPELLVPGMIPEGNQYCRALTEEPPYLDLSDGCGRCQGHERSVPGHPDCAGGADSGLGLLRPVFQGRQD